MVPRDEIFSAPLLGGMQLHALHWGEASRPTVVLLHGGGANAHWWDHLAPDLAQHLHVIALDFRGHGDSAYPSEYTPGAFDIDLAGLLERLGSNSVFLVGASMGGHVALDHAASHPATRAVVALDAARGGTRLSRRRARLALTLRRTYASRAEAISRFGFFPPSQFAAEPLRAAIAANSVMEEPDGRFGYKFDRRWFSVPARPKTDLGTVRCPVLLVRGEGSPLLSAESAEELRSELSGSRDARVSVVEDAGHHVQLDQPDATLAALKEFLLPLL